MSSSDDTSTIGAYRNSRWAARGNVTDWSHIVVKRLQLARVSQSHAKSRRLRLFLRFYSRLLSHEFSQGF